MFDFVSTRQGVDPHTQGCARLLAFLIANAVRDASLPPTKLEMQHRRNDDERAAAALRWIFGRASPFATYAELIGGDADRMRAALLTPVSHQGVSMVDTRHFTTAQRRALQMRYRWMYGGRFAEDLAGLPEQPEDAGNATFAHRLAADIAHDLDADDLITQPAPLVA